MGKVKAFVLRLGQHVSDLGMNSHWHPGSRPIWEVQPGAVTVANACIPGLYTWRPSPVFLFLFSVACRVNPDFRSFTSVVCCWPSLRLDSFSAVISVCLFLESSWSWPLPQLAQRCSTWPGTPLPSFHCCACLRSSHLHRPARLSDAISQLPSYSTMTGNMKAATCTAPHPQQCHGT